MAKVTVKKNDGSVVAQFEADDQNALGMQANDAGSEIPLACGGNGVCGACKCKITKGSEFVSNDKFGAAMTSLDDGEVLSCRAGMLSGTADDAEIEMVIVNS